MDLELTLDEATAEYVAGKVASGEFSSAEDVIRAGLRALRERDVWLEKLNNRSDKASLERLERMNRALEDVLEARWRLMCEFLENEATDDSDRPAVTGEELLEALKPFWGKGAGPKRKRTNAAA